MNTKVTYTEGRKCWFFHDWEESLKSTTSVTYQECTKCKARRAIKYKDSEQDIDMKWVMRLEEQHV